MNALFLKLNFMPYLFNNLGNVKKANKMNKIFIETSRLIIYQPDINDFENLYNLQSNTTVMAFIGNGIRQQDEVLTGLKKAIDHQKEFGFSLGSIHRKNSSEFIGRAGLIYKSFDQDQSEIEVAYALLPEFWGRGYATEVVIHLLKYAHSLGIADLVGVVSPENTGSKKVLTKAGMHFSRVEIYNNRSVEIWS